MNDGYKQQIQFKLSIIPLLYTMFMKRMDQFLGLYKYFFAAVNELTVIYYVFEILKSTPIDCHEKTLSLYTVKPVSIFVPVLLGTPQ